MDPRKIISYCVDYYRKWSEYPSVRDIFYAFVDELWPNTYSAYKRLSEWLRDRRLDGSIPWEIIRDGSGRELRSGDAPFVSLNKYVHYQFKQLQKSPQYYRLPRWMNQPNRVIVACEKEADYPIIRSIVHPLGVDTFYQRGYTGWRPLFQISEEGERKTIILAVGDFDPSGEDIVDFLERAMGILGVNAKVEKVAVTQEQIERFSLPHRPEDSTEIEKLKRDPRFKKWPYGLYRVETAALRVRHPDYFRGLLEDQVNKYFDDKVFKQVQKEEKRLKETLKDAIEKEKDTIRKMRNHILKLVS